MIATDPTVSVVMSVHNGGTHLAESIESILSQTFRDFEFIIIDDGSTDDTAKILASFDDERLVLLSQENQGLQRSLNRGIKHARGQLIARHDADDVSLPHRLMSQVEFMNRHPRTALLGAKAIDIDEEGRVLERRASIATDDLELKWRLLFSNPFSHPSVMMRRDVLKSVGCYSESVDYLHVEDYELWSRIGRNYPVANFGEPLLLYRKSPFGVSAQAGDIPLRGACRIAASNISNLKEKCHLTNDEILNLLLLYGRPMSLPYEVVSGTLSAVERLFPVFCRAHSISPEESRRLRTHDRKHRAGLLLRAAVGHSYLGDNRLCRRLALKGLLVHPTTVLRKKRFWILCLKLILGVSITNQLRMLRPFRSSEIANPSE